MTAIATYQQFTELMEIVVAENNPQMLYTVDKDRRILNLHIRSWGSVVFMLQEAPTEKEFRDKFCYARKVESMES